MIHYYKVACIRDNLKLIREFVNVVLKKLALSENEINLMVLAVDEICSNLIIYSHQCDPNITIEINIQDKKDGVLFEIVDEDTDTFDITSYKEPDLKQIIEDKRKGGMGLMLVNRIMDNVEIKNEDSKKTWKMFKKTRA